MRRIISILVVLILAFATCVAQDASQQCAYCYNSGYEQGYIFAKYHPNLDGWKILFGDDVLYLVSPYGTTWAYIIQDEQFTLIEQCVDIQDYPQEVPCG